MIRVLLCLLLLVVPAHATHQVYDFVLIGGSDSGGVVTGTEFFPVSGPFDPQTTVSKVQVKIPAAQPLLFRCAAEIAPVATTNTYTIEINGADTDWVCVMPDGVATCEDTVGSDTVEGLIAVQSGPTSAVRCIFAGRIK